MSKQSKTIKPISFLILVVFMLVIVYFSYSQKPQNITIKPNNSTTAPKVVISKKVSYKNIEYGFIFSLPDTWKGYSIIEDEWEGSNPKFEKPEIVKGPLISIRHPDWEYKSPRQDIPIMVLTIDQWNKMKKDEFHIGAAPINPSEIGRNKKYVFAIPARYNFAYLTGFEEVDQIIRGDNFSGF